MGRSGLKVFLCCSLTVSLTGVSPQSHGSSFEGGKGTAENKTTQRLSMRGGAKVVQVVSGDTLLVIYEGRRQLVRLRDVDAPDKGNPRANEAVKLLQQLVKGKSIELGFGSPPEMERDERGRLLAYVFADGESVNEQLMKADLSGSQRASPQPPPPKRSLKPDLPQRSSGTSSGTPPSQQKGKGKGKGTTGTTITLPAEPKVYITARDKTYHREQCGLLQGVKPVPMLKTEAIRLGYKPCKRCRP
jgi:hypothetical protein